jgi:hypothetical protein
MIMIFMVASFSRHGYSLKGNEQGFADRCGAI